MKLLTFPEIRQFVTYDCWACALQAVFAYYNIDIKESIIMKRVNTTTEGTNIEDIINVAENEWLKCISKEMTIKEVKEYIDRNIPVLVALQARTDHKKPNWRKDRDDWHYVVAIGYDDENIYFEDPSSFKRSFLSYKEFQERWHDVSKEWEKYINHWVAFFGKKHTFKLDNFEHMD